MNTKKQTGNYYALRCRQTKFRDKGDMTNAWKDDRNLFVNSTDAHACVSAWRESPCDGFVYAMVGLKIDEE